MLAETTWPDAAVAVACVWAVSAIAMMVIWLIKHMVDKAR
jgi:hypothetical protein